MQQTAIRTWEPIRITLPDAPVAARWSVLAIASIAVPAAITVAALAQALMPASTVAPVTFEVPVAPVVATVDVAEVPQSATELPSYFFVDWAAECETECPSRVAD